MFWIALAAQISAPLPIKYPTWFSLDDNPEYLVQQGISRAVTIRAIVGPAGGRPQECEIEIGSGDKALDAFTCGLVIKRATYSPARWVDGTAAFGVDRMRVVWGTGSMPSFRPDLDLSLSEWPKGKHSPALIRLIFAADREGRPLTCAVEQGRIGMRKKSDPLLVQLACERFVKTYRAIPVKNANGELMPSIQNANVRLSKAN